MRKEGRRRERKGRVSEKEEGIGEWKNASAWGRRKREKKKSARGREEKERRRVLGEERERREGEACEGKKRRERKAMSTRIGEGKGTRRG